MAIAVKCPACQKRMVARDDLAGRLVKCSGCRLPVRVDAEPDELPVDPSLDAAPDFGAADQCAEHLRVIRLYLGWLLVCVAVPLGLSLASAAALLILRAV